jgi:hypothetical protein
MVELYLHSRIRPHACQLLPYLIFSVTRLSSISCSLIPRQVQR